MWELALLDRRVLEPPCQAATVDPNDRAWTKGDPLLFSFPVLSVADSAALRSGDGRLAVGGLDRLAK